MCERTRLPLGGGIFGRRPIGVRAYRPAIHGGATHDGATYGDCPAQPKTIMERTKLLVAILLVVAAFATLFASVRRTGIADESAPGLIASAKAKPAPPFTIADAATGKQFSLATAAKSQPLVLDFWATWCGPCRAELPHLETLSQKYAGRAAFYGINSSDSPNVTTAYARQNNLTFPTLSDTDHHVAFQYGADSIPLLVVVDTHGKVRAVTDGYSDNVETELSKTLDALLAEEKRTP